MESRIRKSLILFFASVLLCVHSPTHAFCGADAECSPSEFCHCKNERDDGLGVCDMHGGQCAPLKLRKNDSADGNEIEVPQPGGLSAND